MSLTVIRCKNCGAEQEVEGALESAVCKYCGSYFAAKNSAGNAAVNARREPVVKSKATTNSIDSSQNDNDFNIGRSYAKKSRAVGIIGCTIAAISSMMSLMGSSGGVVGIVGLVMGIVGLANNRNYSLYTRNLSKEKLATIHGMSMVGKITSIVSIPLSAISLVVSLIILIVRVSMGY